MYNSGFHYGNFNSYNYTSFFLSVASLVVWSVNNTDKLAADSSALILMHVVVPDNVLLNKVFINTQIVYN